MRTSRSGAIGPRVPARTSRNRAIARARLRATDRSSQRIDGAIDRKAIDHRAIVRREIVPPEIVRKETGGAETGGRAAITRIRAIDSRSLVT
jgi:hypothetical protein